MMRCITFSVLSVLTYYELRGFYGGVKTMSDDDIRSRLNQTCFDEIVFRR